MQGFSSNFQKRWESKFAFLVTYLIKKKVCYPVIVFLYKLLFFMIKK